MVSDEVISVTNTALKTIGRNSFEHFVGEVFERGGWNTEVTKQSGDGGVDVIASRKELPQCRSWRILIQARRYTANQVQPSTVKDCLRKIRRNYDTDDRILIVSTGECTYQAQLTADKCEVGVWDGKTLSRYLITNDALDLLDKYCNSH